MPELPEVETVRRGLKEYICQKTVSSVDFDTPKSFPNEDSLVSVFLIGALIVDVRRRAKVLMIDLSTNYTLVIHLKMTGQMVYRSNNEAFGAGHPNDSLIGRLPDKSTRVQLRFTDGSMLFFNDQRKFGWMKLLPTDEVPNMKFMQKVGPEPFDPLFTKEVFIQRIRRKRGSMIKAAILDQTTLAGVGNIYADEGLWGASIHPAVRVKDVSNDQLELLYVELKNVLQLAIKKGGSTDKNYVNAEGKRGSYMDFARVFRREGQNCPRCGSEIIKIRCSGRGTHICPVCQKEPA